MDEGVCRARSLPPGATCQRKTGFPNFAPVPRFDREGPQRGRFEPLPVRIGTAAMRILSLRALAAKLTAEGLPTPVLQNSPKAAYGALRVLASNWPASTFFHHPREAL
jgi:hypothetical protein